MSGRGQASVPGVLGGLLGEISTDAFLSEHWGRAPLLMRGTAAALRGLGSWARLERLVMSPCDLLVARDGELWPGPRPADLPEARARLKEGYTLALRQPDLHDAALAGVGGRLAFELGGALNLHLYATPAGRGSFGWHCDPEDVFILQTEGRKRYQVRENTVHPEPLLETLRWADLSNETSGSRRFELSAGDCLYIPRGHWHEAVALTDSLSVSAGLHAPSGVDVLDFLRAKWLQEPAWRHRLPPLGPVAGLDPEEALQVCREALAAAAGRFTAALEDPELAVRLKEALHRRSGGR